MGSLPVIGRAVSCHHPRRSFDRNLYRRCVEVNTIQGLGNPSSIESILDDFG